MNNNTKVTKNIVNDAIIKDLAQAVDSLEYGAVTIKVNESAHPTTWIKPG